MVEDDSVPGNSFIGFSIAQTEYKSFIGAKEELNENISKIIIRNVEAKRVLKQKADDIIQEALVMIRNYDSKNISSLFHIERKCRRALSEAKIPINDDSIIFNE